MQDNVNSGRYRAFFWRGTSNSMKFYCCLFFILKFIGVARSDENSSVREVKRLNSHRFLWNSEHGGGTPRSFYLLSFNLVQKLVRVRQYLRCLCGWWSDSTTVSLLSWLASGSAPDHKDLLYNQS